MSTIPLRNEFARSTFVSVRFQDGDCKSPPWQRYVLAECFLVVFLLMTRSLHNTKIKSNLIFKEFLFSKIWLRDIMLITQI